LDTQTITTALRALKEGDLTVRLPLDDPATRDLAVAYNELVEQTAQMNQEINRVCHEIAVQGWFGPQAVVPAASGSWRELVDHVNYMAQTMTVQVRCIAKIAKARAEGDLEMIATVGAEGETKQLIDDLNSIGQQPMAAV
jgi:methyl-accepting chemotaxis protein